jgi:hypothetical protein
MTEKLPVPELEPQGVSYEEYFALVPEKLEFELDPKRQHEFLLADGRTVTHKVSARLQQSSPSQAGTRGP